MTNLAGEKAEKFIKWLEVAAHYLPPKMSIYEARLIYDRKIKEEDDILNEKNRARA